MHVLRWDLDKTYLATDIHSLTGLLRAAMEDATEKRHVPGAPELLRGLTQSAADVRVSILSGSPRQLRSVLERRLVLDGIRFDSLILKDNLGNLRRGRIGALRGQIGYKLPQLLSLRLSHDPEDVETLFGDDAEVDALIYALYAAILAEEVEDADVFRVMEAGGAYPDQLEHARRSLARLRRRDAVRRIYIHADRRVPVGWQSKLGPRIRVVYSWLQAALALHEDGHLTAAAAASVVHRCVEGTPLTSWELGSLVQDATRRGLASCGAISEVLKAANLPAEAGSVAQALAQLGDIDPQISGPPPSATDWLAYLQATAAIPPLASAGSER